VRTLRAEFTQTYVWGGKKRVESGTVYLVRGGSMRWEVRRPKEKLFLSDGKQLILYVPEEKQLTRSLVKTRRISVCLSACSFPASICAKFFRVSSL